MYTKDWKKIRQKKWDVAVAEKALKEYKGDFRYKLADSIVRDNRRELEVLKNR